MDGRLSVLALDLATNTGWATWNPGLNEPRPHFDAVRLPGKAGEIGPSTEALRVLLNDLNKRYEFTHIFFEAQHVSAKINIDTVYKLIALGGMAEWWSYRMKMACFKVDISTWRKHFIGRGSGFQKLGLCPKEMAIRKCESIGVYTDNDNAADAVGILDFALTLFPDVVPPWRDNALLKVT